MLLGIDIFLGASILTATLDENFPNALPYMLDAGAMFGFVQLLIGPGYLNNFSADAQFWYCVGYAAVAILSVLAINLHLLFVKNRRFLGGFVAIGATIPSILIEIFFVSSYVNGISATLPSLPIVPWSAVYVAFFATTIIIIGAMALSSHRSMEMRWGSTSLGAVKSFLVRVFQRVRRLLYREIYTMKSSD